MITRFIKKDSFFYILFAIPVITMLTLMWNRLSYSVPILDEAYCIAEIYQLIMGNKPFAEIWTASQGASLLFAPVIWLYKLVIGSMDGVFIFARRIYFLSKILFSLFCILALKKKTGFFYALLIILPATFLVPYSFANIGYNTTSLDLILLSVVLSFSSTAYVKPFKLLFFSGVVMAISAIFYPTYIVSAFLNAISLFIMYYRTFDKKRALTAVGYYAMGGMVSAVCFGTIFITLAGGMHGFIQGVKGLFSNPLVEKKSLDSFFYKYIFFYLIKHYKLVVVALLVIILTGILLVVIKRYRPINHAAYYVFMAYSLAFFFILPLRPGSYYLVFYVFIFLAAIITVFMHKDTLERITSFWGLLIPGCVDLIVRTISSASNNLWSSFVAVMPFMVAVLYYFCKNANIHSKKLYHKVSIALMSVLLSSICLFSFYVYINVTGRAEYPLSYYNTKITEGLLRGLYDESSLVRDLGILQNDIDANSQSDKSVLVVSRLPVAYLMTGMTPCTPNTYDLSYGHDPGEYAQMYFTETGRTPDVIFIIQSKWGRYNIDDENYTFNQYITDNYKQTYTNTTENFAIIVYEKTDWNGENGV